MTYRFLFAALAVSAVVGDSPTHASSDQAGARPRFELRAGEKYFRVDGHPAFVLGRNPAGMNPTNYTDHFRHAAAAGERFVRIHFTYLPHNEKPGAIDAGMLQAWDEILDSAEQYGLAVLPVLGVWADWNDGSHKETWHTWDKNPFNVARGGPAQHPAELFGDTPCRKLWLRRTETFVKHLGSRRAIVGWEIFSELDLVTGATEARAVDFAERAAAVIHAADPWKRPITASQAGINEWPRLLRSSAFDFVEIHPYADGRFGGRLDDLILATVRDRLTKYGKPILIGESGLNSGPPHNTLDVAPRAEIGLRHAIWAAVVSGAMNGRAFWWQDGYDRFEQADVCCHYHDLAKPAVNFLRDVDFTKFAPIFCALPIGLKGALLGNDEIRLGWFRDATCEPPAWPVRPMTGQTLAMDASGDCWQAEYIDPVTGKAIGKSRLSVHERKIHISLPEFQDAIAVRLQRIEYPETKKK